MHKDGRLQVLCRTRNARIATAWSNDNGDTWSKVTLLDVPNNNSGTDAVTLQDVHRTVSKVASWTFSLRSIIAGGKTIEMTECGMNTERLDKYLHRRTVKQCMNAS